MNLPSMKSSRPSWSLAVISFLVLLVPAAPCQAQRATIASAYAAIADSLYRGATGDSLAYIRLGRLVDTFGHRFSGSPASSAPSTGSWPR